MECTKHAQLLAIDMESVWFPCCLVHKPNATWHDPWSGIRSPNKEIRTVVVDELKIPGGILDERRRGRVESEHGVTGRCDEREDPMMHELQNRALLVQSLLYECTGL